jgi:plastocyanin
MIRLFALLAALAAAAAVLTATGSAKSPGLVGEVGPGFKIEVMMGTKDVKTLKAGTYTLKVEDKSPMHNFHLIGPGINRKTSVGAKVEQTWTVKLKKGKYTYQCDPHAARGMKGSFTVK